MTEPTRGFEASDIVLHSAWMRRLARALVGDSAAADDVVQDVWTKLGPRRERAGYLAAVLRSFAGRRRRSEHRRSARERAAARTEALPSADEVAARSEIARMLAEAVERLEEPYRTTLVLRYYDDLPAAEIARRAGIPASTVRARLKRGLDTLRARLDERDGGRVQWVSALLPLTRSPTVALGASAGTLITMKLALVSLFAASALVLLWRELSPDIQRASEADTASEANLAQAHPGTGPDITDLTGSGRREALVASSGWDASVGANAAPEKALEAGSVHARAVDEAGAPVPDAWLRLRRAPELAATGDAAGDLLLAAEVTELERVVGLDDPRTVEVEIGARGRRTKYMRPTLQAGRTSLELGDVTLPPGGALNGRVIDEAGRGVEGALVAFGVPVVNESGALPTHVGPGDLYTDPWDGIDPALVGTSGGSGEFRLEGLPAGYGTAWARTTTSLWAFSEPIGVRAGEEIRGIELVVRDAPDETISGRVVDPDGRPVPGLELILSENNNDDGWWNAYTDARGDFSFATNLAALDIGARSPSWEWEDQERLGVARGTHDLVIAFERSRWLAVAVQDQAGTAVRNGLVVGLPGVGPTRNPLTRCESPLDEHGHARLRRPASPFRLRVEAPGFRNQIVGPLDPALFPEPLTVTLEPVPALVGRVLLQDGRPAAGAQVSLHRSAGTTVGASAPRGGQYLSHQGWGGDRDAFVYDLLVEPIARVTADGQGSFRLPLPGVDMAAANEVEDADQGEGLGGLGYGGGPTSPVARANPNDSWYVHAAVDGAATITSGPHLFYPSRDAALDLHLPAAGSIAGKLVLEDGRSSAGWTAYASDGLAEVAEAPVRSDGSFELDDLHEGGWQIRLFEPGSRFSPTGGRMRTERVPEPDVIAVAGRSVAYEHRTHARSSARLLGHLWVDGEPPGAWRVIVSTATPQYAITRHEATLDPDGGFDLTLEPGLSTSLSIFRTENGAQLCVSAHPTILPGTNEWSFDLETARLGGTITLPPSSASPLGNSLTYECQRGDVSIRVLWTLAEDGRFGPLVVPAGSGILRGPRQNFQEPGPVWSRLDLRAGETHRVELPNR